MKNKIVNTNAQQGDILLRKLTTMPDGKVEAVARGRCVLAHGESGHSHVLEDEDAELVRIGDRMLLRLQNTATVIHEEHGPVTLCPGIWEIGRVQEFDYLAKMARPVCD